ncbi:MAG: SRPBCC family protein [Limimaricola sp.]|uniref:SRPBCC family protein n=1 Tax=Limimaricola sp. TaxID=2211665 RepID=UPI001D47D95B|nr:SRPBCC family protein [Limimaricola sp.]MBI1417466.1 SRPBCC family protein [Limimaricola sp.]
MQFKSTEDIEAPIDYVFARLTDFPSFEKGLLRRGATVTRTRAAAPGQAGSAWQVKFKFRGKMREAQLDVARVDPPSSLELLAISGGMHGVIRASLLALSAGRTRMTVTSELSATTITARLLLQSLKLAHGSLANRYHARLGAYAEGVEERYRKGL